MDKWTCLTQLDWLLLDWKWTEPWLQNRGMYRTVISVYRYNHLLLLLILLLISAVQTPWTPITTIIEPLTNQIREFTARRRKCKISRDLTSITAASTESERDYRLLSPSWSQNVHSVQIQKHKKGFTSINHNNSFKKKNPMRYFVHFDRFACIKKK